MTRFEQPPGEAHKKVQSALEDLFSDAYDTMQEHPIITATASAVAGAALLAATRGRISNLIEHATMRSVGAFHITPKLSLREAELSQLVRAIPGKASIMKDGYFGQFVASNHELATTRHYFWGIGDTPRMAVINGFDNWAVKNGYRGYDLGALVEKRLALVKAGIAF